VFRDWPDYLIVARVGQLAGNSPILLTFAPALIATAERGSRFLTVKAVGSVTIARDRSLELWMLPDGRPPQSLGLVPASGVDRVALRAPAGVTLQNIPALAVSLEPAGGSTTGAPTGPVLYTGRVERTY
jgi:anti-sigma-K factor RskA